MNTFIAREYDPFKTSPLFVIIVADDWEIARKIAKGKLCCERVDLCSITGKNEVVAFGIDTCILERVERE